MYRSIINATEPNQRTFLTVWNVNPGKAMTKRVLTKFAKSVASWISICTRLLVVTSRSVLSLLLVEYIPLSFFSTGLRACFARTRKSALAFGV